jgi:hypothetical protein
MLPILWVGPAGSGKLTAARRELGCVGEPTLRLLEIGDYSARYWEFTTHMEVDIMDLSMMDKQILPEILGQLLSTRDVMGSGRKVMILRRIHGLSPTAASRLRVCLEELVWSAGAPAMIWCTARTVNSAVAHVMDGFVYRRVPYPAGVTEHRMKTAISKLNVPSIKTYITEMMRQMVTALAEGPPTLLAVPWIRARIYELLGLMMTGADLVSELSWATVRLAAAGSLSTPKALAVLDVLSRARWVPSYRIPIMLETIVVAVYNALATK